MAKKEVQITIPDYLTIDSYMDIVNFETESQLEKIVNTVSALTKIEKRELRGWSPKDLVRVSDKYEHLLDAQNTFFPLIEWDGELYGFASIKKATLGEYIDLEEYSKDINSNLHKIAAMLYRPVTKNRFTDLKYTIRQGIKMVRNKVDGNVFDWYEVEKYDSDKRLDREQKMRDFPINILLGAISFFLSTGNLYLNHIAYSQKKDKKSMTKKIQMEESILKTLSQSIGGGGELFTVLRKPTS